MVSTKDYDVTTYSNGNSSSHKYYGGLTINVNGSTTNGRGPNKNNSSYKLDYAYADGWFLIKPFSIELKPLIVGNE